VEQTLRKFGRLDALVNNVGVNDNVGLESGTPDKFGCVAETESGALLRHGAPCLTCPQKNARRDRKHQLKTAVTGQGGTSGYVASKGGHSGTHAGVGGGTAPARIRVNAVVPAEVMTPLYRQWVSGFPDPEAKLATIISKILWGSA